MKIGTFLWGTIMTTLGAIAILQGTGAQLDGATLAVMLLLMFAAACTLAALLPSKKEQETLASLSTDTPLFDTQRIEVEPTPSTLNEN